MFEPIPIEEILPLISLDERGTVCKEIRGALVRVNSTRLRLFKTHGITCSCGRKGSYFNITNACIGERAHLALFSDDNILMCSERLDKHKSRKDVNNLKVSCYLCVQGKGEE